MARRLLILMLVLAGVSTLAATLVSTPGVKRATTSTSVSSSSSSTTTTTVAGGTLPTAGAHVRARIPAGARRPKAIHLEIGDQLSLIVASRRAGQVEVSGLGLLEDVAPLAPASFDILAERGGRFEVRRVASRDLLGTLVVGASRAGGGAS